MRPLTLFLLFLIFRIPTAQALEGSRFDGGIGLGFDQLSVSSPATGFTMNNGSSFTFEAEKSFGPSPLFLTFAVDYLKTTGNLNYSYISPTATYSATKVNYADDDFQFTMGLKIKFMEASPLRPYLEVGGLAGYMQVSYDSSLRTPAVVAAGNDFRTIDNTLEFGYYAKAGLEFILGSRWGMRLAYHFFNSSTRSLSTLNNQTINYSGGVYYAGLLWAL